MNKIFSFLKENNAIGLAIGLILSQNLSKFVNSFTNNMIMPTVIPLLNKIGERYGVKNFEIDAGPIHLKVGNFIQSIIELLMISFVVMWIANYAKK